MGNFKPELGKRNLLQFYKDQCETNLLTIEYLELQSLQLDDDINGFNRMNQENIITVTENFGHDQWLHSWQIRQLRRAQMKKTHQYDPSKLFLQAISDPRAHIKYIQQQTGLSLSDQPYDLTRDTTGEFPQLVLGEGTGELPKIDEMEEAELEGLNSQDPTSRHNTGGL